MAATMAVRVLGWVICTQATQPIHSTHVRIVCSVLNSHLFSRLRMSFSAASLEQIQTATAANSQTAPCNRPLIRSFRLLAGLAGLA